MKLKYTTSKLFLFAIFSLFIISCSEQGIHKEDLYDFVTVYKNNEGEVERLQLDNKTNLNIVENLSKYTPKNKRAFINYKLVNDNKKSNKVDIILNGYIYDIQTKDIKFISEEDKQLQDSLGYAGINITAIQALNNYITVRYNYLTDGGDQLTSLISKKENDTSHDIDTLFLEFRQNPLNSKLNYQSLDKYICFDLESFFQENIILDSLVIRFDWITTKGERKTQIVECNN